MKVLCLTCDLLQRYSFHSRQFTCLLPRIIHAGSVGRDGRGWADGACGFVGGGSGVVEIGLFKMGPVDGVGLLLEFEPGDSQRRFFRQDPGLSLGGFLLSLTPFFAVAGP